MFTDVDDLMRTFIALDADIGAIAAQRLTTSAGTRCTTCGAVGTMIWARVRRVCLSCGAKWHGEDVEVPRERVDGADWRRAASARDERLDLHRRLDSIVRPRPRGFSAAAWRFALLAYGWYVQPQCASYDRVVERGVATLPRYEWTTWRVRHAVGTARHAIRMRAIGARMIERVSEQQVDGGNRWNVA